MKCIGKAQLQSLFRIITSPKSDHYNHERRPRRTGGQPPLKFEVGVDGPCIRPPGLLIAVAPRYRYCSGATFTVAVAVAPLLLAESSADSSAATFLAVFLALLATATFKKEN